jgi:two-component system capsular synthesis sensor histidine kinase RcsC
MLFGAGISASVALGACAVISVMAQARTIALAACLGAIVLVWVALLAVHRRVLQPAHEPALEDGQSGTASNAANRAETAWLAMMNHEIVTPLKAMLGNLELLDRTPLDDAQRHHLQMARACGEASLDIVNDLLDVSQMQTGRLSISHASCDLASLARGVGARCEPAAKAKQLDFNCMVDPDLAPRYVGDPARLRQIMTHLVRNAIQSTERGEIVFEVYLEDARRRDRISIGVIDSSAGMTEEQQRNILTPSAQEGASNAPISGIARPTLALCKVLVGLMGGSMECTSTPGVGSTFIVQLELELEADTNADVQGGKRALGVAVHGDEAATAIDVLVVDDHPVNRELLRDQLTALGYAADVAQGGMSALRMLSRKRYHMLLTTLNMPGMDGYALARFVRDRHAGMPIIALTAHVTEHERAVCRGVGIDDVLLHPASLEAIGSAVRRFADRAEKMKLAASAVDPTLGPLPASLRQTLMTTLEASVRNIEAAILQQDNVLVGGELHAIKGAFAMVHEAAVVALCKRLEGLAKAGDLEAVAADVGKIVPMARDALARRAQSPAATGE